MLKISKSIFIETPFEQLMQKRIHYVLLICSKYDAFTLEADGRINEKIFNEYISLNLRYPPEFIQVFEAEKAFEILQNQQIDLVISMLNVGGMDPLELSSEIKNRYPQKPIVVLTPFSREISVRLSMGYLTSIDYVFSWLGNTNLLLAIIKLIEDKMNADEDIKLVGVQSILLIEDSIRYYSSYLPLIYKALLIQSLEFMAEGLNEHQKMMRMRGRPKILLARDYDEALLLFEKYKGNLLGIISDMRLKRNRIKDNSNGEELFKIIKAYDENIPILIQSADIESKEIALKYGIGFLNKNSKTLLIELNSFLKSHFSFGDFVFIDPDTGNEIVHVSDLQELQRKLFQIPDKSLTYHLSRNHLSKWLNARALFSIAEFFKEIGLNDFLSLNHAKRFIFDTIANYRISKGKGVIAEFYREQFDEYLNFTRIGDGSLGGKARGLAYLDSLIQQNEIFENFENVIVAIPKTVVICTDIFDEFLEQNELRDFALSDMPDNEILERFVKARLPIRLHKDLYAFISIITGPVAIRSSSLLEDSHYQPFAGIYSTYMIPKADDGIKMMEMLSNAIKSVYASVFYKDSKAYMTATSNVIDEEKMAVVLQEICGQKYADKFYPTISGVARSINFYPIEPEKPEDGVVNLAFGLGKYIVDGGASLRFSPKYPKKILQLSEAKMALRESQKEFYALNLNPDSYIPSVDEKVNLIKSKISDALNDGSLSLVASTYNFEKDAIVDGVNDKGTRIVTFANILKYNQYPVVEILKKVLEISHHEMNNPVELEFAVNIDPLQNSPVIFNLLQIRPIVENHEVIMDKLEEIPEEQTIVYSRNALGNGIMQNIYDLVYVKPESYDASKNLEIAQKVSEINNDFLKEGRNYILIGPGRWGSDDPWLGIPVKWPQISAARVIIESGLEDYRIDPSQGTHFFQNLTSFKVGYFTINPYIKDGYIDLDFLSNANLIFENKFIRHIRFPESLFIKIDGRKKIGIILKPVPENA